MISHLRFSWTPTFLPHLSDMNYSIYLVYLENLRIRCTTWKSFAVPAVYKQDYVRYIGPEIII